MIIYDVRIYGPDGTLKETITGERLAKRAWERYDRVGKKNAERATNMRTYRTFTCANCGAESKALKSDTRYCQKPSCRKFYK